MCLVAKHRCIVRFTKIEVEPIRTTRRMEGDQARKSDHPQAFGRTKRLEDFAHAQYSTNRDRQASIIERGMSCLGRKFLAIAIGRRRKHPHTAQAEARYDGVCLLGRQPFVPSSRLL
jgi:hypothetical protein